MCNIRDRNEINTFSKTDIMSFSHVDEVRINYYYYYIIKLYPSNQFEISKASMWIFLWLMLIL